MLRFRRLSLVLLAVCSVSAQTTTIEQRFAELRKSPPDLHEFLYRMPKGADLHNHLSGAAYAENIVAQAARQELCVDTVQLRIVAFTSAKNTCANGQVTAAAAQSDNNLMSRLIDVFSMRDFVPATGQSGHDHFFDTFGRFGPTDSSQFITEVVQRASDQNESYLELMAISGGSLNSLGKTTGVDVHDFDATRRKLETGGLNALVKALHNKVDDLESIRTTSLGCSATPTPPSCRVKVGYVYQVLRENTPDAIFAQIMAGFAVAKLDPRVVAVNFVQPEDGFYSMRDYHLHMQMIDYAKKIYPDVHVTLHAGELWQGLVPPDGLRFHIREAVELGHAERIGHGVDIMFEKDAPALMAEMKAKHIAVEINLTSNDGILGVKGDQHPFPVYRKYGVPVELSTDDEGVSRSDLTAEFERAVLTYHLTYAEVKQLVRNSIEYSFAPKAEKAALKSDLEARFTVFEKTIH